MRNKQKGFSLIELLIVVAIILIIAAIAIPNLLRARIAANEASAVSSMRTMNTACITYNTSYGAYPTSLTNLAPIPSGTTPSSTSADLLDATLTSSPFQKSGYTFTFGDTGGAGTVYTINGDPITLNTTGVRQFYTDQTGVIHYAIGASAAATDSPL
jgi:prepilin-type N-terminal cleavage/methylation domain-containing protein